MRKLQIIWRLGVLGCAVMVIAMTLVLWSATGRAGYTKYHDPDRAQRDAEAASGSIEDLFDEAGAEIKALPEVANRFELGLLPGGLDKSVPSVLTIAGPASLIAAGSIFSLALFTRRLSSGTPKPTES